MTCLPCTGTEKFLSTPSARRATREMLLRCRAAAFLSTPSARRATRRCQGCCCKIYISIHALREEGDGGNRQWSQSRWKISIHALREEGDGGLVYTENPVSISIHALREEGDQPSAYQSWRPR